MPDASYELLVAAKSAMLAGDTAGYTTSIYDRVPEDQDGNVLVNSPYISFGPSSSVPDDFECIDGLQDGEEVTIQIDVWSWGAGLAYGSAECRIIASAIKRDLHDKELSLETNALVTLRHTLTRIMRDPDGITNHAAIQFTAVIETP